MPVDQTTPIPPRPISSTSGCDLGRNITKLDCERFGAIRYCRDPGWSFRMVSVSNTILAPGFYVISGLTDPNAGNFVYYSITEVMNPAVSRFSDNFIGVSSTLTFPGTQVQGATDGFYGPMFGFAAGTSSISEPASFGLVAGSLLAALLLRRVVK